MRPFELSVVVVVFVCVCSVVCLCSSCRSENRKQKLLSQIWYPSIVFEDVPLVEFLYLVFSRMPGESVVYLCYVFRALIKSFVC